MTGFGAAEVAMFIHAKALDAPGICFVVPGSHGQDGAATMTAVMDLLASITGSG